MDFGEVNSVGCEGELDRARGQICASGGEKFDWIEEGGQLGFEGVGFREAMDSGMSAGRWCEFSRREDIPLNDGRYSAGVTD